MTNKKNLSVLRKVTSADIERDPYPHIHVQESLPPFVYDKLAASFPDVVRLFADSPAENDRARAVANNVLLHANAM
ncbi:MAG: hypothetical protein RIC16_05390 [Rhodospirillales bacterium]